MALVGGALAAALLGGCSGQTLPPSDVTETSATLRAKAECGGNPPCYYYFRYRMSGTASWENASSPRGPYPDTGGTMAPLTEPVSGLDPGKPYEYQLCGKGDNVEDYRCVGYDGPTPQTFRTRYRFGPEVSQTGDEELVFDWSSENCEPQSYADEPARAFRDSQGQVQLLLSHHRTFRMRGPNLNSLTTDCSQPVFTSHRSNQPSTFNNWEWIGGTYTLDGSTVYALVHNEYHGWDFPGMCNTQGAFDAGCWYNAITFAKSTDGGTSFTHPVAPTHLVASAPYQYRPNTSAHGLFSPSNIVSSGGYYYALLQMEAVGLQTYGTCVIRTSNLNDPASWRGWSGSGWTVQFVNPYPTEPSPPNPHVCQAVSQSQIVKMHESITGNSHFGKWVLVGETNKFDPALGRQVHGFYYSTSSDFINWSGRKLLMEVPIGPTCPCIPERVGYPSLIDPSSSSPNFGTTGQTPYIYFTRTKTPNGNHTDDRDLVRIPIEFD